MVEKIIINPKKVKGYGNVIGQQDVISVFCDESVVEYEDVNGVTYPVRSIIFSNEKLYFTNVVFKTVPNFQESFTGVLKDNNGDVVVGASVSLLIDYVSVATAITDSNGVVTFNNITFTAGEHDVHLSYNNVNSKGIVVNCIDVDHITVDNDLWIMQGNNIDFTALVSDHGEPISNVPVQCIINGTRITSYSDNDGVASFSYTGKGYDSTIQVHCGNVDKNINVHDSILCLRKGELLLGKNYSVESRPTGPGTGNAYMEWQGDVFKLTPTKELATGTANYVNSKFYYKLKEVHWIDETTVEVVDNDVSFANGVVEFTYMGGTGNLPLNFYAWKNNDGTDPYVVLRFNTNTGKYWSSCMQNGTIVQNNNISGSLKVNDKFRIEFDDGIATVYKNGVVLTTLTYDSEELHFGFIAAFNGSSMYKDFNIQTVPQSGSVVDGVVLSSDKSILSYKDSESCVLTATVLDLNDNPCEDVTVTFKKGNVVLGTDVTDVNGEATYTYASSGVGAVSVIAEVGSVSSDPVTIEDCDYYNPNEVSIGGTNKHILYDSNLSQALSTNYEVSFSVNIPNAIESNDYRYWFAPKSLISGMSYPQGLFFDKKPSYILFDIYENGGYRYSSHQRLNSGSGYITVKYVKTNKTIKVYINDNYLFEDTVSWIDNYNDYTISLMKWSGTATMYIKNVKFKRL